MPITEKHSLAFSRLWQAVGWLMISLVVVSTLMPHPPEPPVVTWDKAQHLLVYGALMFWFRMAFAPRSFWIAFLIGLGIMLEFLQGWLGYRHFDHLDMAANTLGVLSGLLLAATPLGTLLERLDQCLAMGRQVRP